MPPGSLVEVRENERNRSVGLLALDQTAVEVKASNGVEVLYDNQNEELAWVGRGPWRDLVEMEQHALFTSSRDSWADNLVLLDLSTDLLAHAQKVLLEPLTTTSGTQNDSLAKAIGHFRHCFCDSLKMAGFKLDTAGPADLIVNQPGMQSTAYDYEQDRSRGLHIDNHQSLPLTKRGESFVLASINIGWQPRYLHFLPTPISTLLHRLELSAPRGLLPREIKDLYLRQYPNDPIFRVTIPPATSYLLRTQNYIHDGETLSGTMPDVVFLMMGNPA